MSGEPPAVHCPACGAAPCQPLWSGRGVDGWRVMHCTACDAAFTFPTPSDDELAASYAPAYYGEQNQRFTPLLEGFVRALRARRARTLQQLVSRGRVLDIGCGRGWTLHALRERGFEVQGVELSEHAARHAREQLQLDVAVGPFEPDRYADASFDAIILWHVIEHLRDAPKILPELARLLKPGGVLALSVPNRTSDEARRSRHAWFHLDLPRHLWHFSADELCGRLERAGFAIERQSHLSWEQNVFGAIQSQLNACGCERNLLYDLLRGESARRVRQPWRAFPGQSLLSLLGLITLLVPACLLNLVAAARRRGATIDIYARRK